MGLQGVKFTKATYTDLLLPMPATIRPIDVSAARIGQLTDGSEYYEYQYGVQTAILVLVYDQNSPLSFRNYMGGFNQATGAQDASTQSLINWYLNVAFGGFTAIIANDTHTTVNMLNAPTLGFKPIPNQDDMWVGNILLRVEY